MKILSVLISAFALASCSYHGDRSASAGATAAEAPSLSGSSMGTVVGPDSRRARSTEPNPFPAR